MEGTADMVWTCHVRIYNPLVKITHHIKLLRSFNISDSMCWMIVSLWWSCSVRTTECVVVLDVFLFIPSLSLRCSTAARVLGRRRYWKMSRCPFEANWVLMRRRWRKISGSSAWWCRYGLLICTACPQLSSASLSRIATVSDKNREVDNSKGLSSEFWSYIIDLAAVHGAWC